MKAPVLIRVQLIPRWWLWSYLYGVALMAYALGTEPDWEKVERVVMQGFRIRLVPVTCTLQA